MAMQQDQDVQEAENEEARRQPQVTSVVWRLHQFVADFEVTSADRNRKRTSKLGSSG